MKKPSSRENNNANESKDSPINFNLMPDKEVWFKRTIPVNVYDFYIIDEIEEPEKYINLIQTLKTAEAHDSVFIYLNTVGGSLYTTMQILSAMNSSAAKIITSMEGQVCSAGTFIFLKGDAKIVNPNCTFMIHNYSHTTAGKGNEVVQHITYMKTYFDRLAHDVYGNFLEGSEIERIVEGNDIWLHSHEVVERLEKYGHEYIYTGEDIPNIDVQTDVVPDSEDKKKKKGILSPFFTKDE